MNFNPRRIAALLLTLLLSMGMVACSSDTDDSGTTPEASEAASDAGGAASEMATEASS